MVGGRSRESRSQYCRPGEPAIANHQTHHEVNKEKSLRLGASGARNRSPRRKRGIPAKVPVHWTASPERDRNQTNQRQGQTSQKHQLPTRRATATSRHSRARPESLECGPTSLPRGSWNVMPAATWKLIQTTQVTRFLGRLPASCWDGRPVQGVGWSHCVGYR